MLPKGRKTFRVVIFYMPDFLIPNQILHDLILVGKNETAIELT